MLGELFGVLHEAGVSDEILIYAVLALVLGGGIYAAVMTGILLARLIAWGIGRWKKRKSGETAP